MDPFEAILMTSPMVCVRMLKCQTIEVRNFGRFPCVVHFFFGLLLRWSYLVGIFVGIGFGFGFGLDFGFALGSSIVMILTLVLALVLVLVLATVLVLVVKVI